MGLAWHTDGKSTVKTQCSATSVSFLPRLLAIWLQPGNAKKNFNLKPSSCCYLSVNKRILHLLPVLPLPAFAPCDISFLKVGVSPKALLLRTWKPAGTAERGV